MLLIRTMRMLITGRVAFALALWVVHTTQCCPARVCPSGCLPGRFVPQTGEARAVRQSAGRGPGLDRESSEYRASGAILSSTPACMCARTQAHAHACRRGAACSYMLLCSLTIAVGRTATLCLQPEYDEAFDGDNTPPGTNTPRGAKMNPSSTSSGAALPLAPPAAVTCVAAYASCRFIQASIHVLVQAGQHACSVL